MATDREKFKFMQLGQFNANNSASSPAGEVASVHKRTRNITKVGTENAATNVAEQAGFVVVRKSKLTEARWLTGTNVATSNSVYVHLKIYKRTSAGATQTLIAQWNTHGGAQGTVTQLENENMALTSTSGDLIIAAGSVITYEIIKASTGTAVAAGDVFSLDLEEV